METMTEVIAVAVPPPPRPNDPDSDDRAAALAARIATLLDLADVEFTKTEQGIVAYRERWDG